MAYVEHFGFEVEKHEAALEKEKIFLTYELYSNKGKSFLFPSSDTSRKVNFFKVKQE
jgi:hypothetical protein